MNIAGGRIAHPLLISLANIKMSVRNKGSLHAFLLLALLPIAQFSHPKKRIWGVLDACLFHHCLDLILDPLKKAATIGWMMSDPFGNLWYCFTLLVSCIVDIPEAAMIDCMHSLTSHVTMATYKNYGDAQCHEPCTTDITLSQLASIDCDPLLVEEYFAACTQFQLSGVSHPYWRDWPFAEPSQFFTPEALHHWHGEFWNHDVRWCIQGLGDTAIDFQFSIIPPITGLCQFPTGITKLKQICGRTKRDIEWYLVVVIAGAMNPDIVIAIYALMEFHYMAQAPALTLAYCDQIKATLQEFHHHKNVIIESGLCRWSTTGAILEYWQIPKLKLFQSVTSSIEQVGSHVAVVCKHHRARQYWGRQGLFLNNQQSELQQSDLLMPRSWREMSPHQHRNSPIYDILST